jgi:hypothetical protein
LGLGRISKKESRRYLIKKISNFYEKKKEI